MSGKCEKHGYVLCPQCAIDKERGILKNDNRSESRIKPEPFRYIPPYLRSTKNC